jgi:hypothetical protein
MQEHLASRPQQLLVEVQRARETHETIVQHQIDEGARAGDPGMIAIKMKQEFLAAERGASGSGGAGADQPIDFTREVESIRDMTETELIAVWRANAMKWDRESGKPCPVCGHVHEGNETNTKGKE